MDSPLSNNLMKFQCYVLTRSLR